MRRAWPALAATVGVLFVLTSSSAAATSASPSPCPSPSPSPSPPASGARTASPAPSPSPCSSADQQLLQQVQAQLSAQLASALAQQQQVTLALEVNAAQQQLLGDQISAAQAKISDLDSQIQDLDSQISSTQETIAGDQANIALLAKALYAQPNSLLVLATQSSGLDDLLTRTAALTGAGARANTEKLKLEADLKSLQAQRDQRAADRAAAQATADQEQQELDQLTQLQADSEVLNQLLADLIATIRGQLSGIGGDSALAAQLLANLNAAQLAALQAASKQIWQQVQLWLLLHPLPGPAGGVLALLVPLLGGVETQPFGPSPYKFEPPYGGYPHFHTGIDLAAPLDSAVMAAYPGVVVVRGYDPWGYGNYVILAHGAGITTLYAHLDRILAQEGQSVGMGQLIGLEGTTGNSTGPHLHFEVRFGGVPQDPAIYLPAL